MKILVFDNYDSFTYNLVHMVEKITDQKPDVCKNDEIEMNEIAKYDRIILSPGPGIPKEAGLLLSVVENFAASKSILGVCLGHQAIGEAFGGKLVNLDTVYHGRATTMHQSGTGSKLFEGLGRDFPAGRYHSWVIDKTSLPADLEVTAVDDDGNIMAMQHKTLDVQSMQFHPESILTPGGETILRNWLKN